MKLKKFVSLFLVLLFSQFSFAQETPKAVLINEFENNCSEIIALHYDNFLAELSNDPSSAGFIVFNGEEAQEGTNLRYIQHLSLNYPGFRGFDQNRITLIRGENRSKMRIQFWKVPFGSDIPEVEKTFEAEEILSPQRFQKTDANLMKPTVSKNEEFVDGFYAFEGCEFAPNLKDFAAILSQEKDLNGYLVIRAKKNIARKINSLALEELTKNFKISPKRVKIVFGDETAEPELELWLVPQGETFLVK